MLIKNRFIPASFDVITEVFVIKADTAMKIHKQREKDDEQLGIFEQWSDWDLFISIEKKVKAEVSSKEGRKLSRKGCELEETVVSLKQKEFNENCRKFSGDL